MSHYGFIGFGKTDRGPNLFCNGHGVPKQPFQDRSGDPTSRAQAAARDIWGMI